MTDGAAYRTHSNPPCGAYPTTRHTESPVKPCVCAREEHARVGEEHDSDAGPTVSRGNPLGETEAKPA